MAFCFGTGLERGDFCRGAGLSFLFFFIARSVVGLGEDGLRSAAQSMISRRFHRKDGPSRKPFSRGMLLGGAAGHVRARIVRV